MAKAVAKKSSTEVARPDFMTGAGRGNEDVSSQDIVLPRISIIQSLSPQRKRNDEAFIEGAEEGMLFNTVTNELYPDGITVVPVYHAKEFVLWRKVDAGGGFIGSYKTEQEGNQAWAQHPDKDSLELCDTSQNFVLILHDNDGGTEEAVISMAKSQRKPARVWNSMIKIAGGDRFERQYRLSGVGVQNKQGQDYYNWKITQQGYVNEATFHKAEEMYKAVVAGERSISQEAPQGGNADREDI